MSVHLSAYMLCECTKHTWYVLMMWWFGIEELFFVLKFPICGLYWQINKVSSFNFIGLHELQKEKYRRLEYRQHLS